MPESNGDRCDAQGGYSGARTFGKAVKARPRVIPGFGVPPN